MGLVFVEVMLAVEERFGIKVPDEEVNALFDAGRMHTVGDLHALVMEHLRRKERVSMAPGVCPTSAAFYRARRGVVELFDVSRNRIRPETPLDALVPRPDRRRHWRHFAEHTGLPLRGLCAGPAVTLLYMVPAVVLGLLVGSAVWDATRNTDGAMACAVLTTIALAWAGSVVTRPVHVGIPANHRTMGDLARYAVGTAEPPPGGPWTEKGVYEALVCLLVDQVKVEPEDVTMDASLEKIGAVG